MNDLTQESGDYEDFINYINSLNFNNLENRSSSNNESGDSLLDSDWVSIIAAGIDPVRWAHFLNRSGSFFGDDVLGSGNQSISSDGISIWEEGKISIPLYTIIFLLGIIGNGLVILTILKHSRMRTVTNLFLLNLAISDLLLGVFCIPFTLVGTLLRDFVFGEVFCKLIPYLQAVSVSVSGWTLVAISVERFYGIRHPLTSRKWQTRSHARRIILSVWLGSLVIPSPIAILSQLKPAGRDGRRKCREVWPDATLEKVFNVSLDVVMLFIPFLLMVVMYSLIVNHLWRGDRGNGFPETETMSVNVRERSSSASNSGGPIQQQSKIYRPVKKASILSNGIINSAVIDAPVLENQGVAPAIPSGSSVVVSMTQPSLRRCNPEQGLRTKRRVLKMLIVVVLEFFICWTPLYVINTLSFFAPKALYEGLGYTGISLVQLLAHASCCCNPITYCFMSSSFRRAFLNAFGCSKEGLNNSRSNGTI